MPPPRGRHAITHEVGSDSRRRLPDAGGRSVSNDTPYPLPDKALSAHSRRVPSQVRQVRGEWKLGRPPALPVEQKLQIVMDVLAGRTTIVRAARDHKISETAVCNWKRQFLEAGRVGLADGAMARDPVREAELRAENDALKEALREASVQARVWKVSAEGRLGPFQTLR